MSKMVQLVITVFAVAAIAALVSNSLVLWLKIETSIGGYWHIGQETNKQTAFMAGSSLAGNGLAWGKISDELGLKIEGWGVAGSSPSEWEIFQSRATRATLTIIVISPYDMNEYFLSDFRAEVAPMEKTIKDLWESGSDWSYRKRVLSSYPLSYIRILYPTAGRSDGVMAGVRDKLAEMGHLLSPLESGVGPTVSSSGTNHVEENETGKVSSWPSDRMLRRLVAMGMACQRRQTFNGPKRLAFLRMMHNARKQGHVLVVVLPVSPAYSKEFLTVEVNLKFEKALAEARTSVPTAHWIRLDQVDDLNSNEYFWDLVHMNLYGQKIATEAFLRQFKEISSLQ